MSTRAHLPATSRSARSSAGGSRPAATHPVHVQGASFQVVSRTGGRGRVYPWERHWEDTVSLEDCEVVDVITRFDADRGIYLVRCRKLEHEHTGLMANVEVVSPTRRPPPAA